MGQGHAGNIFEVRIKSGLQGIAGPAQRQPRVPPDQAVDHGGLCLLLLVLEGDLFEEHGDFELGPEHVLLDALARGVARLGDALEVLRDLLVLGQDLGGFIGKVVIIVGGPEAVQGL